MNIHAIIQARSASTRLPRKVLKTILGKPMLVHQYERVKRSRKIDKIIIATSTDQADDGIAAMFSSLDVSVYRGHLTDVLERFYLAAKFSGDPDYVIRLTGDCPLVDWKLIDRLIDFHIQSGFDYSSNCRKPTFPDGLDAEIFSFNVLEIAHQNAKKEYEREHVTPYIYFNSHKFRVGSYENKDDYSNLRWTVDEADDFKFVSKIYQALYPLNPDFDFKDILKFLEKNAGLSQINNKYVRNEKFEEQVRQEK